MKNLSRLIYIETDKYSTSKVGDQNQGLLTLPRHSIVQLKIFSEENLSGLIYNKDSKISYLASDTDYGYVFLILKNSS